jgi:hypothetical protein
LVSESSFRKAGEEDYIPRGIKGNVFAAKPEIRS